MYGLQASVNCKATRYFVAVTQRLLLPQAQSNCNHSRQVSDTGMYYISQLNQTTRSPDSSVNWRVLGDYSEPNNGASVGYTPCKLCSNAWTHTYATI